MPIATSATNSRAIVLPDYVQLLLGFLLVTLFLCVPIVAYTNHVKWAAALADPVRSAQAAPETIAPLNIPGPEKLAGAVTISPSHTEGSSSRNTTQIHSGTMSSMRTSTPNYISGDELATPKRRTSIRIVRKSGGPTPLAGGRSAGPTLPRAWSRANSSRNGKAVLMAILHQTFKRSQNSKIKSSRS